MLQVTLNASIQYSILNLFHPLRCGPCKFVAPVFEQFVTEYPEVDFYKVDVDETDDVAAECGIQAMPTFQFFKGGEKIEEVRGADVARLKAIIEANK